MNWIPEYWDGGIYYPPRPMTLEESQMIDGFTREELMTMVAKQMATIHQLHSGIEDALNAIDNGFPDVGWKKLLQTRDQFEGIDRQ